MIVWRRLAAIVAEYGAAALISVHQTQGSAPREAGARMIVRPDGAFHDTIGGGRLEWQALGRSLEMLRRGRGPAQLTDQVLGPGLGQCCGGRVTLLIETFDRRDERDLEASAALEREGSFELDAWLAPSGRVARLLPTAAVIDRSTKATDDRLRQVSGRACPSMIASCAANRLPTFWVERYGDDRTQLLLFGAGHVGRALVLALAPLPFSIRWVDSREDAFPAHILASATPVRCSDPVRELGHASRGSFVLVMTHDHPLDLAITAAALRRDDLPFVGLIGSATKRARFEKRLRELGIPDLRIASLSCPIGLPGIESKEPAAIAASVTAQLLQLRESLHACYAYLGPSDKPRMAVE